MPPCKTRGIVVRSRDFTETSRLVNFLTPDSGLVKTLAKGALRPASPLRGKLELPNYGHLVYYPSRSSDLHVLAQFDLIEHFPPAVATLERSAFFHYLAELASAAAFGPELGGGLFQLLLHSLRRAEQLNALPQGRIWFEIRYLYLLGVLPPLAACAGCGGPMAGTVRFSPAESSWLCPKCAAGRETVAVEPGVIAAVRYIQDNRLERVMNLRLSPRQFRTIRGLLRYLVDSSVEKKLKSRQFLDQVVRP
jgi:DNA repair protein RecO (recombination protein O)